MRAETAEALAPVRRLGAGASKACAGDVGARERFAGVRRDGAAARNACGAGAGRAAARAAGRHAARRGNAKERRLDEAVDAKAKAGAAQEAFAAHEVQRAIGRTGLSPRRKRRSPGLRRSGARRRRSTRASPIWRRRKRRRAASLRTPHRARRRSAPNAPMRWNGSPMFEREKETAVADLARLAPARPLSERWQEIDEWLTKRGELLQAKRACDSALASAVADTWSRRSDACGIQSRDAQGSSGERETDDADRRERSRASRAR